GAPPQARRLLPEPQRGAAAGPLAPRARAALARGRGGMTPARAVRAVCKNSCISRPERFPAISRTPTTFVDAGYNARPMAAAGHGDRGRLLARIGGCAVLVTACAGAIAPAAASASS